MRIFCYDRNHRLQEIHTMTHKPTEPNRLDHIAGGQGRDPQDTDIAGAVLLATTVLLVVGVFAAVVLHLFGVTG